MYKQAIILAAGKGSRLSPLTDNLPKPLVKVNDEPIIFNALENLEKIGAREVYVVIGYLHEVFQLQIGNKFNSLNIHYVLNKDYATTNSMYSLWLGLKSLGDIDNTLILEGDVFFEKKTLENIPASSIYWFGDSSITAQDGCYLKTKNNKVKEIKIYKKSELKEQKGYKFLKSAGILAINKESINGVIDILEKGISENKTNLYYDLIFADNLNTLDISVIDIQGKKWFEIDSTEDLLVCEKIFNATI
jgi:choline kinase